MFTLYHLLLHGWMLAVRLAALRSAKARAWLQGQQYWRRQLGSFLQHGQRRIWVHCASYGEFQDGSGLLELIRTCYPDHQLVITFFSPSGYDPVQATGQWNVVYLPRDTRRKSAAFLDALQPEIAVFVRHDIWPNYLRHLAQRGIPAVLAAFFLRDRSGFTRWPQRRLYRKAFAAFRQIQCQDERTATQLNETFGLSNTVVCGNPRIDTILRRRDAAAPDGRIVRFIDGRRCVIAGSVTPSDQALVADAFSMCDPARVCWIIVAHDPFEAQTLRWQREVFPAAVMLSQLFPDASGNVIWVDSVGMLPDLYQYAQLAYVGGGFSRMGIHSILEPAAWNCRICFGPAHRGYDEALALLASGGASIVTDAFATAELFKRPPDHFGPLLNEFYVRSGSGAASRGFAGIKVVHSRSMSSASRNSVS